MILSDLGITEAIKKGELKIDPFDREALTPNGYDLSINEMRGFPEPKSFFLVSTTEFIELSGNICAQLWVRSSFARRGIFCSFGKVDAGFEGTLTIGCFNAGDERIELKKGERFVQIVFERMLSPAEKKYTGRYRGQRGIKVE
ncbi:MAG: dCTP deaminase [Candidatus Thermoplasmatota archaeon]|nr:dCTP deaminase [Candidatus Thermoplasmatota archaeon]